jgi:hypothetical protein
MRYTSTFIFFLNNRNLLLTTFYLKYLLLLNYKISFIIDINYHKNTLFLLNKFKFLSVAPVSVSSNIYLVDIAFVTPTNSNYSNYFFIRNLLYLKKISKKLKYTNLLKI